MQATKEAEEKKHKLWIDSIFFCRHDICTTWHLLKLKRAIRETHTHTQIFSLRCVAIRRILHIPIDQRQMRLDACRSMQHFNLIQLIYRIPYSRYKLCEFRCPVRRTVTVVVCVERDHSNGYESIFTWLKRYKHVRMETAAWLALIRQSNRIKWMNLLWIAYILIRCVFFCRRLFFFSPATLFNLWDTSPKMQTNENKYTFVKEREKNGNEQQQTIKIKCTIHKIRYQCAIATVTCVILYTPRVAIFFSFVRSYVHSFVSVYRHAIFCHMKPYLSLSVA